MADTKKSTIGGIPYDDLCRGTRKYYSFNLVDLVDTSDDPIPLPFNNAVKTLVKQVESIFTDIRFQQEDKELEAFTIGKTHARRVSTKRGPYGRSFHPFDRKDPRTWKFDNGINNRWRDYFNNQNYDGLVALTAITNDIIPADIKEAHEFMGVEQYSIALEQSLIRQWVLNKPDSRLANESFHPGNLCKGGNPYAGVVYVAFKLRDVDQLNNSHDDICDMHDTCIPPEIRTDTELGHVKRQLSKSYKTLASNFRDRPTKKVATFRDEENQQVLRKPTKYVHRKRAISETQPQNREESALTEQMSLKDSITDNAKTNTSGNTMDMDFERKKKEIKTSRKRVCFDDKEEKVHCPTIVEPSDFENTKETCQRNKHKVRSKRKRFDNDPIELFRNKTTSSIKKIQSKSGAWSLTDSPKKHSASEHRRVESSSFQACSKISFDKTVNSTEIEDTAVTKPSSGTTKVGQVSQRKGKSSSFSKESTRCQKSSPHEIYAGIRKDKPLDQVLDQVENLSVYESNKEHCREKSKYKTRKTESSRKEHCCGKSKCKSRKASNDDFVSNHELRRTKIKVPGADDIVLSSDKNDNTAFEKHTTYICNNETISILLKHPLKRVSFPSRKISTDGYTNVSIINLNNSLGLQRDSKADVCAFLECLSTDEWQDHGGNDENQHQSYQCSFCGEWFEGRDEFERHENIHTMDILFLCKYCRKEFTTDSACTSHEKMHEEQAAPSEDEIEVTMDHNGGCGSKRSPSAASTLGNAPDYANEYNERRLHATSKLLNLKVAKSNIDRERDVPSLNKNDFNGSKMPTKQLTIEHFFVIDDTPGNQTDDDKPCKIMDTSVDVDYPQDVVNLDESDDDQIDNNSSKKMTDRKVCGYCSSVFEDILSRKSHERRHHISFLD